MTRERDGFSRQKVTSWGEFIRVLNRFKPEPWIYRGQSKDWPLATTLERCLKSWNINPANGAAIENQLRREFQRRYWGADLHDVKADKLYCFALMQHHGAPTRLLDFSYSPFVAAHNAIKDGENANDAKSKHHVIWAFRGAWMDREARNIAGPQVDKRNIDVLRDDATFEAIYQCNPPKKFVLHDNPFLLNERLSIQQGIFICPGNVNQSLLDNLKAMPGFKLKQNILKLELHLSRQQRGEFAHNLKLMNISAAALFPGLDGFARSLGEQVLHHEKIATRRKERIGG